MNIAEKLTVTDGNLNFFWYLGQLYFSQTVADRHAVWG